MEQQETSAPFIITNVIAIAIAFTAMVWPTVARASLSVVFIGAFAFNVFTAIVSPTLYLEFGELTPNDLYRSIILGPFSKHVQLYVVLIATAQLLIGVFLSYKGRLMKVSMIGGIIFLLAISPLGFGAAFPSTLILATSIMILMSKRITLTIYEIIFSRPRSGNLA